MVPLLSCWTWMYFYHDSEKSLEIISNYWLLSYHIKLKYSDFKEFDDVLLSAWTKFIVDKGRSFHVVKMIFHIEEFFRLDFYSFIFIIIRTPNNIIWGILEFVCVRQVNFKLVKEIEDAFFRFKIDGAFFLDADHLVIRKFQLYR